MKIATAKRFSLGGIALAGLMALMPTTGSAMPVEVAMACDVPTTTPGRFAICGGSTGGIPGSNVDGWDLVFEDMQHLVPPSVPFQLELDFSWAAQLNPADPFFIGNVELTDMDTVIPELTQGSITTPPSFFNVGSGTWTVEILNDLNGAVAYIHDFHISCEPGTVQDCNQVSLNSYRFVVNEQGFEPGVWAMPEPGSIALLGLGLLATGAVARRRRKVA